MSRVRLPRRPAAGGFTLLELLVVVVVLSIMAGVVAMSSADRGGQAVELGAVQVTDALQRAATLARSQRRPHGVAFDVAADRFAIVDEDGVPAVDPLTRKEYIVSFHRPNQPPVDLQSASFGTAGSAALFDAQGVPLTGGQVRLQSGSATLTLTLDAATGRVTSS